MNKNITVVLVLVLAAGCVTNPQDGAYPMDPRRKVSAQDCTRQIDTTDGGNLLCREVSAAERRARIAGRRAAGQGPEGSRGARRARAPRA